MNPWQTAGGTLRKLAEQQLLSNASITDGTLEVIDCSSRNRNFLIQQTDPLFVKVGLDAGRSESLKQEAQVYQLVHQQTEHTGLQRFLPKLRHFHETDAVLITDGLVNSKPLHEVLMEDQPETLALAGQRVGEALAAIANQPLPARTNHQPDGPPWPFRLAVPDKEFFLQSSAASQELIQIIQRYPKVANGLESLRKQWTPSGLIHNDFKPDNVIFLPVGGDVLGQLRIIDWEISGYGDPHWDVGILLAALLVPWIRSVEKPGTNKMKVEHPASKLFPFTRSFWQAYTQDAPTADLIKAVQYAGVGLFKVAMETSDMLHKPQKTQVLFLQAGSNLIQNPQSAAATLFGLHN